MTKQEIERLVQSALDVMCAHVQQAVGQTDGGVAALFWSGDASDVIRDYVETELSFMTEE
jgi:hypothetical protein